MRKTLFALLWLIPLVVAFCAILRDGRLSLGDPDRYYHFALSRDMVASGQVFLRSVPQVEDLGWGELFVDKEFLFHQLTALGYRIAGDGGVSGPPRYALWPQCWSFFSSHPAICPPSWPAP